MTKTSTTAPVATVTAPPTPKPGHPLPESAVPHLYVEKGIGGGTIEKRAGD
jgi:hypothetical protein